MFWSSRLLKIKLSVTIGFVASSATGIWSKSGKTEKMVFGRELCNFADDFPMVRSKNPTWTSTYSLRIPRSKERFLIRWPESCRQSCAPRRRTVHTPLTCHSNQWITDPPAEADALWACHWMKNWVFMAYFWFVFARVIVIPTIPPGWHDVSVTDRQLVAFYFAQLR